MRRKVRSSAEAGQASSGRPPEILVHLGLAKTGTSAIQRALCRHKAQLLAQQGILYPGSHESHALLAAAFSRTPELNLRVQMEGIRDRAVAQAFLQKHLQSIRDEIQATRPQRIVISTEDFSALSLDELRSAHEFLSSLSDRISLFLFVRDPWSNAISLIQEYIRTGLLADRVDWGYVRSNVELIRKFEHAFGRSVMVAPYLPLASKVNVVEEFSRRFGIDPAVVPAEGFRDVNRGMNKESAIGLLQLFRHHPRFDEHGGLIPDAARDWIAEAILAGPGTPIRMSQATAEAILRDSTEDLELLQYRYLGGSTEMADQIDLMEFDDNDSLSPQSQTPQQVHDFAIGCMRRLSEMAVVQYVDRVYWNAMYHAATGNPTAAAACFKELVDFPGGHARLDEAIQLLREAEARIAENASARASKGSGE